MAKRAAGGKIWAQNYGLCPQLSTKRPGDRPAAHGPVRPWRMASIQQRGGEVDFFGNVCTIEGCRDDCAKLECPVNHMPALSHRPLRRSRPVAAGCAQVQLEGRAFSERGGAVV